MSRVRGSIRFRYSKSRSVRHFRGAAVNAVNSVPAGRLPYCASGRKVGYCGRGSSCYQGLRSTGTQ